MHPQTPNCPLQRSHPRYQKGLPIKIHASGHIFCFCATLWLYLMLLGTGGELALSGLCI